MLRVIDPRQENRYIKARNAMAHRTTLQQAREDMANDDGPHLLQWVELMDACEATEEACMWRPGCSPARPCPA